MVYLIKTLQVRVLQTFHGFKHLPLVIKHPRATCISKLKDELK